MRRVLRIARTEILEHRRQPTMILILAANYALWAFLFGMVFATLDGAAKRPEDFELLRQQMAALGVKYDTLLQFATTSFVTLNFADLPLTVAIMSGTSVLHDRACGTMPFLMLAPLTRRQLLLGKLTGAMAIPLLLHLVFVGVSSLLLSFLGVLAPYADKFGRSAAWWVAFLVSAPASAAFVGSLGAVISALSRDIRTSMQFTSILVIGLISPLISLALVQGMTKGVTLQLVYAGGCLVLTALTLLVGARQISQDVTA